MSSKEVRVNNTAYNSAVFLFHRLQKAIDMYKYDVVVVFKPKQIKCWEHLLNGFDVIGVLPTGYGKSIIFQLLADILP